MFRPIKNLSQLDYHMLLVNGEDDYYNETVNSIFDKWNKKYGNVISFDEDDTDKNNIRVIATQVLEDLKRVETDEEKILTSLVKFLYGKPSTRKKKLFWYIYGKQLYSNLLFNLEHKNICRQCGCRTGEMLVRGKCFKCRQEEIKKLGGKKLIKCVDCNKDVVVDSKSRVRRCHRCDINAKLEQNRQRQAKFQKNNAVRNTTNLQKPQ